MFSRNLLRKFLVTVSLFAALPAAAQIEIWDLDNGVKNTNTNLFDSLTISNGINPNSLTITGWSNTGNGNTDLIQPEWTLY